MQLTRKETVTMQVFLEIQDVRHHATRNSIRNQNVK